MKALEDDVISCGVSHQAALPSVAPTGFALGALPGSAHLYLPVVVEFVDMQLYMYMYTHIWLEDGSSETGAIHRVNVWIIFTTDAHGIEAIF